MAPPDTLERAARAEQYYNTRLKAKLEATARDQYVAIEPDSGDYFLALTIKEAVEAARKAHPDKYPHIMRVGHRAAVFVGGSELVWTR
jgi:hypothetical protein